MAVRTKKPVAVRGERPTTELLRLNAILDGLSDAVLATVLENGKLSYLPVRQKIYEPEKPIRTVYFPLDCVLSVVTQMNDGSQIEIGTIGREGMSAFPLLMGAAATANDCYCQVPGSAAVISADVFRQLSTTQPGFRQLLDRYLQAYVNMLGQLAACNRLHSVHERCARWLLITFDRVGSDEIPLTHEYLAMMLGTSRSGVTIAAASLQQAGFVRYSHGNIWVLDRAGLEDAACECYQVSRKQFDGLLRNVSRRRDELQKPAVTSATPANSAPKGRAERRPIEGGP